MSRNDPPLRIRLPEQLKTRIQTLAAENHRSMNAEIVARLEWSLQGEGKLAAGQTKWIENAKVSALAGFERRLEDLTQRLTNLEATVTNKGAEPPKTVFKSQKRK